MLKRTTCLLIIAIILMLVGVSVLANDARPRVTGSASDPISGYYVVYEHKGATYRSDEMGPAFNRNMWRLLDDADRQKVISGLGYRSERITQFGTDGDTMIMEWYAQSNEWSQAKRYWESKLSGKYFPALESFYSSSLAAHFECYNQNPRYSPGKDRALYDEFYEVKATMNDYWNIGTTAYGVLGRLKGKQITVAVNFGSKEIIKMLSDTYMMPAVTRGAKPLSDALGQAFGIAADQGMGMMSAPPSPGDQIAAIESLIEQCKATAETVMVEKLPALEANLANLLNQMEQDAMQLGNERLQQQQQEEQAHGQQQTEVNNAVTAAYATASAAMEQQVSLSALINQYVPKKGDAGVSASDYISYRNWATGQITALMAQIRTELAVLEPEYQTLRSEYEGYEQGILDKAGLESLPASGSSFLDTHQLIYGVYSKKDRFYHEVNGIPFGYYRMMIESTAENALQDFATDLFTHYGYAEGIPYYALVRSKFFDDDRADYTDLINEYGDYVDTIQSVLDNESDFFAALSDLKGRIDTLRGRITALERLYNERTNPYNYNWYTDVDYPAPMAEFFAPLYPLAYPATDIAAFIQGCRSNFNLFYLTGQSCLKRIEEYSQSLEDLDLIEGSYCDALDEYISAMTTLAAQYSTMTANYENALSQVYTSIKGIREAQSEYFQSASYTSYYYDGNYYHTYNMPANPSVKMSKIQSDLAGGAQRESIIAALKSLKTQEEAYLRQFETAKAHQNYYASELTGLSTALQLDSLGHRASLSYILGGSNLEKPLDVVYRMFPEYPDRDLVTSYTVEQVNGSNMHHAIEMLEGKTENYYKLQNYRDKISGSQGSALEVMMFANGGVNENTVKSVYQSALAIYQYGRTSTITYAQNQLAAEHFALLNELEQTGVDYYTEPPQSQIRISGITTQTGEVAATIENESGDKIENAFVILGEYEQNGALLGTSIQKVTKIENLYSDTKIYPANKEAEQFKIMLWKNMGSISPMTDAFDSALNY
ncbi:MAG: hypothetical protein M0R40_00165 [Firmicutes bacterium]|nr:hypothetical protein [Bacillota bacterium]